MGIFNSFKKKKEENSKNIQKIDKNSFVSALFEMSFREIEYIEPLLKLNNINYDFNYLVSSTFSYYFSVWLSYIEKNYQSSVYNELKSMIEKGAKELLTNSCKRDNIDHTEYINHFIQQFSFAIEEAKSSIQGDNFYDKGITNKFLYSFLNNQDTDMIRVQMEIRILQYWVKGAEQATKITKFTD